MCACQVPIQWRPAPRGNTTCPGGCSGKGVCDHDLGLCYCPSGTYCEQYKQQYKQQCITVCTLQHSWQQLTPTFCHGVMLRLVWACSNLHADWYVTRYARLRFTRAMSCLPRCSMSYWQWVLELECDFGTAAGRQADYAGFLLQLPYTRVRTHNHRCTR